MQLWIESFARRNNLKVVYDAAQAHLATYNGRGIGAFGDAVTYSFYPTKNMSTVEGGMSWPITFHMIRPHIDAVYVKDFRWVDGKPDNVPLGQGQISPKFFDLLAESNFQGPISLHEEYLDHRKPELVTEHLEAIKADLSTLNRWLKRA